MVFGKLINKYYFKYFFVLLLGVAALIAVDYFQLRIPEIYGQIIDGLDPTTPAKIDMSILSQLCLDLLVVLAIMVVGRFLWRVCLFGSAIKLETDLRNEMFSHAKELSQNFYSNNKVGNIMALFTNDIETINECFGDGILMTCDALFLGSFAFYKMIKLNLLLALLSLIPIILLFLACNVIGKSMMLKWKERQEKYSDLTDFANESFSGLAVIKAFVKEGKELLAFRKINKANEKVNIEFTKLSTLLQILVSFFTQTVVCIVLGVGGYLASKGEFNASKLIMFLSYFTSIVWPITAMSRLLDMSSRGKASLARLTEFMDSPIEVKDRDTIRKDIKDIKGKIEFRNMTFSYPGTTINQLDNVSFTINAGENIGVIGKTGSGKSTLVDLILRTYNVPDNTLFIDDIDVNEIPIKQLRDYAAYVPQDNFLFSDTIANNIAFAGVDKNKKELVKYAAHIADLDSNLEDFPDGYDTLLGERGVTISGGQKQRTSIARAIIKDASILILDDSVSAVDTNTEKTIIDNLKETRKNKTTILIAHRVTTIEKMDKVLFIDDGKVLAFGKHLDLYKSCVEYQKMVDLQKLEDEAGGESLV